MRRVDHFIHGIQIVAHQRRQPFDRADMEGRILQMRRRFHQTPRYPGVLGSLDWSFRGMGERSGPRNADRPEPAPAGRRFVARMP